MRCPSGVVDGLHGKRKLPLLMALLFFPSSESLIFLPEGVVLGSCKFVCALIWVKLDEKWREKKIWGPPPKKIK
jgi:hypothetical protein